MQHVDKSLPSPLLKASLAAIDSSPIRRAFDLSAKLQNPLNLSIGQPHFPTPPEICEALCQAVQDSKTAYTQSQGIPALREALQRKYSRENSIQTEADNILITSGVSSLIQLLFMSALEKGDAILLTDPAFLIYRSLGAFFGAKIYCIPETFSASDLERLPKRDYKLIMISHPSNPSGYIYSREQILLLANFAEQSGALLVCDEIYELYDYDGSFQSPASLYPRSMTLSGFSKSYSMTGLRLAAATGPKEIIQAMLTLQQYTVVCAPTPVQYAGIKALELDMSPYAQAYKKNRDFCIASLEPLRKSGAISYTYPAGAFYIFIGIKQRDEDFVRAAVQKKKLLVVPGNIFGASRHHIRISYALEHQKLRQAMAALLELLAET